MAELSCRFIKENGTKAWLRVFWGSQECLNRWGPGRPGHHNARVPLTETDVVADWDLGGSADDYPDDRWSSVCDHCSEAVPLEKLGPDLPYNEQVHRQVFRKRRYNTASGAPEPGDMFYSIWRQVPTENGTRCSCTWSNCDGQHLYVILPNGSEWDVDSRARNCTLKDDETHRCWVRVGDPPNVTAGKTGHTCSAGAGSIAVPGWHGFLRGGKLVG